MYLVKTPIFIQKIYQRCTWSIDAKQSIYLTFDDGPDPSATPWVLDTLRLFDAKATFFCIGKNVEAHPQIIDQVLSEEHAIGNHSYSHLSGWTTRSDKYISDVKKCADLVDSNLFRPPYGRLKPSQLKELLQDYKIIMWDVMCGDFEARLSPEKCLRNITQNAKEGSIILLHDSPASIAKLKYVLPEVLAYFTSKGFKFESIPKHI